MGMVATKSKRMGWGDYAVIYVAQTLPCGEAAPRSWWEVVERYGRADRELVDAAFNVAGESFGEYPYEDGTQLFKVKTLTLKESAIAAKVDRTHAEKINEIRPLREKRRTASEAAQARVDARPSKYELEFRRKWEERIASAVVEAMAVSVEDRAWAAQMGHYKRNPGGNGRP